MNVDYDVLIIGGGLVGASLACGLRGQALRIGIVEAVPITAAAQPSYDDRAIALAQGTQTIFAAIGVWDQLSSAATPIHKIHVSERGRFGFAHLDREQEGVAALGYVIPARAIGAALMNMLQEQENVELLCPAHLNGFSVSAKSVQASLAIDGNLRDVTAGLMVAADGAKSAVRQQLGMPIEQRDYGQTVVVTRVTTQHPNQNVAYERFTDTGPLAVLPVGEHQCTVVWTVANEQAEAVLRYSDDEFLEHLQERFGYRLGCFQKPGARHAYPLRLARARESVHDRVALIGNAANALHPIAGQGFNLGIRDVAALAETLVDALQAGADPGSAEILQRYAEWRKRDHNRVVVFTDGLIRLFTNPLTSVAVARNLGMCALEFIPALRTAFSRLTMGRSGKLPRLSRGLPL